MALFEKFSYRKSEMLWLLSCKMFETKYIDTSFQVANRTEIEFPAKNI